MNVNITITYQNTILLRRGNFINSTNQDKISTENIIKMASEGICRYMNEICMYRNNNGGINVIRKITTLELYIYIHIYIWACFCVRIHIF